MVNFSRFGYLIGAILVSGLFFGATSSAFFQSNLIAKTSISFPFPVTQTVACSYDVTSDASFQKYLSDTVPFANKNYVPSDLLPINSNFTANNSTKYQLRKEAGIQFADMARKFWDTFGGDKLSITSAYRSFDYQKYLLLTCKKDQCAAAGTSEHQAGLALDLGVKSKRGSSTFLKAGNKYYDRLSANAHLYGFHNTYQKGVAIDGKIIEARHRRYVGVELATQLHNKQQTFAEWVSSGVNQTSCPSI